MFNVQRAKTPKVSKPELGFMCSAHRLIVLYICVKIHENISDSIRLMMRTQIMEALTDRRTETPNIGGYNIITSPLFVAGIKIRKISLICHLLNFPR